MPATHAQPDTVTLTAAENPDEDGRQGTASLQPVPLHPPMTSPAASFTPLAERTEKPAPQFALIQAIGTWMRSNFSRRSDSLKEALEEVLDEHEASDEASAIGSEERQMLENILEFGELEVGDVLIPRPNIIAVPHDAGLMDVVTLIQEQGHTRMPVYRDGLDDILGLIHIKDLIRFIGHEEGFHMPELLRPMTVVPPSMKVTDLLMRMRSSGTHMALVVDEFGGTEGIVTLENLFERIVGDIHDEYDEDDGIPGIQRLSEEVLLVNARLEIEELEKAIGMELADEGEGDFHTVGGLIFDLTGEIPRKGRKIDYRGLRFEVVEADARSIHRVRLKLPAGEEAV